MTESKPLAGQVALVTGASRGIGLAIAAKLGAMGAQVALSARNAERLADAEAELRQAGCKTFAVAADVARAADIEAMVRRTNEALGEIDILVNNAGMGIFRPVCETSEEEWDTMMDTNLKGVFLCTRAVAPQMIRRGSGQIINISSLAGKNVAPSGGVYYASKWGLQGLTGCLAEELRAHGIRVSAVCPGSVATEFSPRRGRESSRMLQAGDVAHVVAMLVTQAPQSFASEVLLRPTQKP